MTHAGSAAPGYPEGLELSPGALVKIRSELTRHLQGEGMVAQSDGVETPPTPTYTPIEGVVNVGDAPSVNLAGTAVGTGGDSGAETEVLSEADFDVNLAGTAVGTGGDSGTETELLSEADFDDEMGFNIERWDTDSVLSELAQIQLRLNHTGALFERGDFLAISNIVQEVGHRIKVVEEVVLEGRGRVDKPKLSREDREKVRNQRDEILAAQRLVQERLDKHRAAIPPTVVGSQEPVDEALDEAADDEATDDEMDAGRYADPSDWKSRDQG